jgi:hypothetical protein
VADFDPTAILEVLTRHRVDFILIGGFAGVVHGSPLLTHDVDVVPEGEGSNLARLSGALTELEAKVRNGDEAPLPFRHDATSLAGAVFWNLSTRFGDLDITFSPSGTDGYRDLHRGSIRVNVSHIKVEVAALADIIRSKEAAGRDKDRRALPILRELLAEELKRKRTT